MGFITFPICTRNWAQKATQSTDLNFKKTEAVSEREWTCEAVGQEEARLTRYRPDLVFGKAMALHRCNYSYVYLTFGMKNFGIIWKNVAVSQSSSPQHLSVPTPWVRDNRWWSFRFWKAHARHVISFVIFNGWRYVIGIHPPRGLHAVSMKTGKHTWNKAPK